FSRCADNVTRTCLENGTWADRSDYSSCRPLIDVDETTLYYIGYGVSLCALTIALWIFLYYKNEICWRSYCTIFFYEFLYGIRILKYTYATPYLLIVCASTPPQLPTCVSLGRSFSILRFDIFWKKPFSTFLLNILRVSSLTLTPINVRLPAVVVAVWAATKAIFSPNHNDPVLFDGICVWQLKDIYDCIFICPVVIVLLVNIFFMGEIMWVLITKLRAATTLETQQYRKAAKALLVLIPLLGVTYILVIWTPSHKTARIIFTYLQITLLSTQVRSTIRHHLERWRASRALRAERLRTGLSYRVGCRQASQERVRHLGVRYLL
ncbi:unnamed protein product, partial [Ixodes pacificus]